MSTLAETAHESDEMTRTARHRLVTAIRQAAREGMTQSQIAREVHRSQPEVSRLLRFHGSTPLARKLRRARPDIVRILHAAGGRDVRVFGSVAMRTDGPDSDVDLLFTMTRPLSLLALGRQEGEIREIVGVEVDLVPESTLLPHLRERVLDEAVPL